MHQTRKKSSLRILQIFWKPAIKIWAKGARTTTSKAANHGRGHAPRSFLNSASTSSGGRDEELLRMIANSIDPPSGGCPASIQFGQELHVFHAVWPRQYHIEYIDPMSLRITIFLQYFQELVPRAKQLQLKAKNDALVMNFRSKNILTDDKKWAFLTQDTQTQMLKANKIPPLFSKEFRIFLERIIHLNQQQSMLHKCSILRPINQEKLPQDVAVAIPWRLKLNLRISKASELHQHNTC